MSEHVASPITFEVSTTGVRQARSAVRASLDSNTDCTPELR
jgi:hypothetical protein